MRYRNAAHTGQRLRAWRAWLTAPEIPAQFSRAPPHSFTSFTTDLREGCNWAANIRMSRVMLGRASVGSPKRSKTWSSAPSAITFHKPLGWPAQRWPPAFSHKTFRARWNAGCWTQLICEPVPCRCACLRRDQRRRRSVALIAALSAAMVLHREYAFYGTIGIVL